MPGFPYQGAAASHLAFGHSLNAPRLTLFGSSRGGCAYDQAVGGGVSLTIPLKQDVFFAWSGGAIYLPAYRGPEGKTETAVRADVVFQRPGGRAYTVGVSMQAGVPRVSFGGIF